MLRRSRIRPEAFGPIGGVIKSYPAAGRALDRVQFAAERVPLELNSQSATDLRGYIPYRKLLAFRRWLSSENDRETAEEALTREIGEEIEELGAIWGDPSRLSFRRVRIVEDGPKRVASHSYLQYRRFYVLELQADSTVGREFVAWLSHLERSHPGLAAVTFNEISAGRTKQGDIVASNSEALCRGDIRRPDQPPFHT